MLLYGRRAVHALLACMVVDGVVLNQYYLGGRRSSRLIQKRKINKQLFYVDPRAGGTFSQR